MSDQDDGWDWPWLLFVGTVLLGYTEDRFWMLTPLKFCTLVDKQQEYNRMKSGNEVQSKAKGVAKDGFIDQISGW